MMKIIETKSVLAGPRVVDDACEALGIPRHPTDGGVKM